MDINKEFNDSKGYLFNAMAISNDWTELTSHISTYVNIMCLSKEDTIVLRNKLMDAVNFLVDKKW